MSIETLKPKKNQREEQVEGDPDEVVFTIIIGKGLPDAGKVFPLTRREAEKEVYEDGGTVDNPPREPQ